MPLLSDGSCAPSHMMMASSEDRVNDAFSYVDGDTGMHTGFVVAIHYPADKGYDSSKVTLYDIVAAVSVQGGGKTWLTYRNARWGSGMFGSVTDFSRVRLNVPKGWNNGAEFTAEMMAQSSYVAFFCENGRSTNPVIVGLLEHPSLFDDSKEWGHYSASSFNGVNTLIDKDGQWSVTFTGAILDPATNAPITPPVPLAGQIKGPDFSAPYKIQALPVLPLGFTVPPMPSIPALPAIPAVVSLPSLPSLPSVPMPGIPKMPGMPALPGAPAVPSLPSLPGVPAIPGNLPVPPLPGAPSVPGVPALPSPPTLPGVPGPPSIPVTVPTVPGGLPSIPAAPGTTLPGAPGVPAAPSIPTGPTTIMIDKFGSLLLDNTNGEVIKLNKADRAVQIGARSMMTMVTDKDHFTYVPNGKVTFLSGKNISLNSKRVCVGSEMAIEPMVLGNQLAKAYLDLLNAFLQTPVIGQLGAMPVSISPALVVALTKLIKYGIPVVSPFLSKKGFLE